MSYQVMPPNHPAEVVAAVEQGLLLPSNPLMNFLLECALARAMALHPVNICAKLVEPTHIHFLFFVQDPKAVADFMERFKTESAHYINAMLGRKKRTVWCEGSAPVPILTLSRLIEKLVYIYTNPAKDNLETSIDLYPGLSTWKAFRSGRHKKTCKRLHRPMIPWMPEPAYSKYEYKKQVRALKKAARGSHVLTFTPDAWMPFFGITDPTEKQQINEQIVAAVKARELEFELTRKREGKSVIGAQRLATAHLEPDYVPERTGKKMWCLCDDTELRVAYINWAKEIKQKARDVYQLWKQGDFSVPYPPGVFPPPVPKLANMTALACDY